MRTVHGAEPPCLTTALAYAAHGWSVLPLRGKRPLLPDWTDKATTKDELIRGWWEQRPDANVGILTGPRSGLAVLDVDPRHGGSASLAALEARVGPLPGTVQSLTGGGGLHLLYAHPGRKVTSRANSLGAGLDVRADGAMIVAPPSVHPGTGRTYAWLGGIWDAPLPPWPPALLPPVSLLTPDPSPRPPSVASGRPLKRLEALVQFVLDSQPGARNKRLFWAACRADELTRQGLLDPRVAARAMQLAGEATGQSAEAVRGTVRSAFRGAVSA